MVFCTYLTGIEKKRILMFLEEDSMLKSELKSETASKMTLRRQVRRLGVQGVVQPRSLAFFGVDQARDV